MMEKTSLHRKSITTGNKGQPVGPLKSQYLLVKLIRPEFISPIRVKSSIIIESVPINEIPSVWFSIQIVHRRNDTRWRIIKEVRRKSSRCLVCGSLVDCNVLKISVRILMAAGLVNKLDTTLPNTSIRSRLSGELIPIVFNTWDEILHESGFIWSWRIFYIVITVTIKLRTLSVSRFILWMWLAVWETPTCKLIRRCYSLIPYLRNYSIIAYIRIGCHVAGMNSKCIWLLYTMSRIKMLVYILLNDH